MPSGAPFPVPVVLPPSLHLASVLFIPPLVQERKRLAQVEQQGEVLLD